MSRRPRAPAPSSVLGMFYQPVRAVKPGAVTGAQVAVGGFTSALLEHAELAACRIFAAPDRIAAARDELGRAIGARGTRIGDASLDSHRALLDRFSDYGFTAWCDVNADVVRPFRLRRAHTGRLYPITVTHHTISYEHQLHDWYLRLLLEDVRACDAIVCTSVAARDAIRKLLDHVADDFNRTHGAALAYRGRLDLIPLGVDTELFRPRDKRDVRRQLGLAGEPLMILWIGRLSAADKADLIPLVQVFRRVVARAPARDVRLVIAGSDALGDAAAIADYARELGIADRVTIMTDLDPARGHLLHAAADVFVSPADSIQESFGLAPVEAMACGVPQVVADWNGYRDTVVDGETGFRIPTLWARADGDLRASAEIISGLANHLALAQSVAIDLDRLEHALHALLADGELRARMGAASRARAVARYAWPRVIADYQALWHELGAIAAGARLAPGPTGRELPYVDAFGHYATAIAADTTALGLTPFGARILAGADALPFYHGAHEVLDEQLLKDAIVMLAAARRRKRPLTIGELAAKLQPLRAAFARDRLTRHVLWLVKYGIASATR